MAVPDPVVAWLTQTAMSAVEPAHQGAATHLLLLRISQVRLAARIEAGRVRAGVEPVAVESYGFPTAQAGGPFPCG